MVRPPDKLPDSQGPLHDLVQYFRGRLKLYLGYAPGVGRTTCMLRDAQQLRRTVHAFICGFPQQELKAQYADQSKAFPRVIAGCALVGKKWDLGA
jgi:Osmosensitive K+ channel His kinase sensor domain